MLDEVCWALDVAEGDLKGIELVEGDEESGSEVHDVREVTLDVADVVDMDDEVVELVEDLAVTPIVVPTVGTPGKLMVLFPVAQSQSDGVSSQQYVL